MLQQLLWTEVFFKGSLGLLLAFAPGYAVAAAGFPSAAAGFWPRLVGGLLLGIVAALLIQGSFPAVRTITPAGLIIINLSGAAVLVAQQVLSRGAQTRRGKLLVWLIVAALALLSLVEIAFA